MNFKSKGAYFLYVTAFEMIFDVAKIVIIFQSLSIHSNTNYISTSYPLFYLMPFPVRLCIDTIVLCIFLLIRFLFPLPHNLFCNRLVLAFRLYLYIRYYFISIFIFNVSYLINLYIVNIFF